MAQATLLRHTLSGVTHRGRVQTRALHNHGSGMLSRRTASFGAGLLGACFAPRRALAAEDAPRSSGKRQGEVAKSEEEWLKELGKERYAILRKEGTERPFTSPLNNEKRRGTFVCAGCGSTLFASDTKFDSGTGWPSFYRPVAESVDEVPDFSIFFMPRTEVRCHKCQGHLGHVFTDGPAPTGLRYCMNGLALRFEPQA